MTWITPSGPRLHDCIKVGVLAPIAAGSPLRLSLQAFLHERREIESALADGDRQAGAAGSTSAPSP